MSRYLIDTNIFVDANRGAELAIKFLSSLNSDINISIVTALELLKGAQDKKAIEKVKGGLDKFNVIYLNENVQKEGMEIFYKNKLKHGIGIFDSLMAATAIDKNLILITRNVKHFKEIRGLQAQAPY